MRFLALLIFVTGALGNLSAQTLMVNEVSNGPSGVKEYVEYVVLDSPCKTVDLRGWILDDNNGDFACGPISGVGIAQGHVRFAAVANWAAVPAGAIILVHNDADPNALVPANDPTDANADKTYIVPISSTLFERTSGTSTCPVDPLDQIPMGCSATCPATGASNYSPSTYVAGGNWGQISLANGGDAAQTRTPAGAYFHGVSFGNVAAVTGGPDNLKISNLTGSTKVYAFSGGNFRSLSNWTEANDDGIAGGGETPGARNNAANTLFIDSIQGCVFPVTYKQALTAVLENNQVNLFWATGSESSNAGFTVLRMAGAEVDFSPIGSVESRSPSDGAEYSFVDPSVPAGMVYYRLSQVDLNGAVRLSRVAAVDVLAGSQAPQVNVFPNPATNKLFFATESPMSFQIRIFNVLGKEIASAERSENDESSTLEVDLTGIPAGMYLYAVGGDGWNKSGLISIR